MDSTIRSNGKKRKKTQRDHRIHYNLGICSLGVQGSEEQPPRIQQLGQMARRERRLNEKTDFMHLCCLSNKDLCEEQPWKSNPFHEIGRNRRLRDTRDWSTKNPVPGVRQNLLKTEQKCRISKKEKQKPPVAWDKLLDHSLSRQVHFEAYVHLHPTSSSSSTNGDEQVELDLLAPRPLDVEKFCSVFPAASRDTKSQLNNRKEKYRIQRLMGFYQTYDASSSFEQLARLSLDHLEPMDHADL